MSEIKPAVEKEPGQEQPKKITRREFLKVAGRAGAALVASRLQGVRAQALEETSPPEKHKSAERGEIPSFFNAVLERLNRDFWLEAGDDRWMGDMMHDAPSFAPFILYRLGQEQNNHLYIDRANRTVEQEVLQIDQVLEQIEKDPNDEEAIKEKLYPALMGHMGLIEGLENYSGSDVPKEKLEVYSQGGVLLANLALILGNPEEIDKVMPPDFNRVQAFSFAAEADFQLARITGNPLWDYLGVYLTDQMVDQFWTENDYGSYFSLNPDENMPPGAWNQGYSLVALAGAYAASGDTSYLDKKRAAVQTTLEQLGDSERGGFFNSPDRFSKHLSANAAVAKGLIRWKQLDTDSPHDEEIQQTFDFLQNDLLERDLLWHHWDTNSGRADFFCTGCNFFALDDVYENSRLIQPPREYKVFLPLVVSAQDGETQISSFDTAEYQKLKRALSSPNIRKQLESFVQEPDNFFNSESLEEKLDLLSGG